MEDTDTDTDMVVLMPPPVHLSLGLTRAMDNGCCFSGSPQFECFRLLLIFGRSLQSQNDVEWTGAWCNRSAEWNREWMKRLDHSFAKKNVGPHNDIDPKSPWIDQLH